MEFSAAVSRHWPEAAVEDWAGALGRRAAAALKASAINQNWQLRSADKIYLFDWRLLNLVKLPKKSQRLEGAAREEED